MAGFDSTADTSNVRPKCASLELSDACCSAGHSNFLVLDNFPIVVPRLPLSKPQFNIRALSPGLGP